MARSDVQSVEEYLKLLPEDRREAIGVVRDAILENLPSGYEETSNTACSPTSYRWRPTR